jgi:hypothetical protein
MRKLIVTTFCDITKIVRAYVFISSIDQLIDLLIDWPIKQLSEQRTD